MANKWVVNASPLILLGKLNRLELLEQLAFVKVPNSVIQEIKRGIGKDPTTNTALKWSMARSIKDIPLPESIIRWDVGAGESQVIAHCLVNGCCAVLDDAHARSCALAHNIRVIDELGVGPG